MTKLSQKIGLTLVELVVSSLLIAIVLLGVVAFNLSLTQIQDDSFNHSTLSIQASTALSYLKDDIAMTFEPNGIPPGIISRGGANSSLCLRQPDATPTPLIDNPWICYIFDNTNNNLKRCVPQNVNANPVVCDSTGLNVVTNLVRLQNGNFYIVGTTGVPPDPGPGLIRITLNAQDGTGQYSISTDIAIRN